MDGGGGRRWTVGVAMFDKIIVGLFMGSIAAD